MTQQHPITPTLKLFRKWTEYRAADTEDQFWWRIATQAAQWGANQELEACCEWLGCGWKDIELVDKLRSARRPKPPSLKEQALVALHAVATGANDMREQCQDLETIRLALEQLDD